MLKDKPVVVNDMFLRYMPKKQVILYYLLRALDTDGNGRIAVKKDTLFEFLNTDEQQFKKWLSKNERLLFRGVVWRNSKVVFFPRCQFDIADDLKITYLKDAAFTEVTLGDVVENPKKLGVEIAVKYHQHKTHYQLKHNEVKQDIKKKILPLQFANKSSSLAEGAQQINFNNKPSVVVVDNDDVVSYGTSQQKLANKLGVSLSTIKRYLKDLELVKCYKKVKEQLVYVEQQLKTNNYYFFFNHINCYVQPLPNIYINNLTFLSKRKLKHNYNKYQLAKATCLAAS